MVLVGSVWESAGDTFGVVRCLAEGGQIVTIEGRDRMRNMLSALFAVLLKPEVQWELPLPQAIPLAVKEDLKRPYLYIALKNGGFGVVKHGAEGAKVVATLPRSAFSDLDVVNLRLHGDHAFLALGDHFSAKGSRFGAAIVDVSDPEHPTVSGTWVSKEKGSGSSDILYDPTHRRVFLAAMSKGVVVLDEKLVYQRKILPDVNFPKKNPGKLNMPNARGLALYGDPPKLSVANDAGGIRLFDEEFREVGRYVNAKMGSKQQAYNHLEVRGRTAFCTVDYAGLEVIDISQPGKIRQLGWWNPWLANLRSNTWFNSLGHANQLVVKEDGKQVFLSAGDSEFQVADLSDMGRIRAKDSFGRVKNGQGAWGLDVRGNVAYVTYIRSSIPFRGTWSGIRAIQL